MGPPAALPLHHGTARGGGGVLLVVREAAGPFGQAWDARCKEAAVLPPRRGLGQRLTWESRWEADAPSLSGKDGVWKSDEELRQGAGLLGEAWRPCLPRGHALCVVGARWAPGQAATSWRAFDDEVASSRVPRTHHQGSRRATCQVCIKPRYPALFHVPCPSKAEDLLRAAHFRKKTLLGPLETPQRLATGQVSSPRKRVV